MGGYILNPTIEKVEIITHLLVESVQKIWRIHHCPDLTHRMLINHFTTVQNNNKSLINQIHIAMIFISSKKTHFLSIVILKDTPERGRKWFWEKIPWIKVSKFQKQIFLFTFEPKTEWNYFLISALRI